MTHDELLANCKPDSVLYSMVSGHRPTEPTLLGNVYCHECLRVEGTEKAHYPCPTIQAIEKEIQ